MNQTAQGGARAPHSKVHGFGYALGPEVVVDSTTVGHLFGATRATLHFAHDESPVTTDLAAV